ncbi:MAG: S9 family peptidase [Gemmatimonadetes bacterium]|nr:S9 family peptidase [Gemmatimonadota bacterium]
MSHKTRFLPLVSLLVASAVAQARAQSLTLAQVLSAPFPSDLTAAPSGGTFAWAQDDRGMRNLWVAEAPAYQGRQVTRYAEDDGQELSNLQFTPDGLSLVYVRGGPPNRAGEIPNPTSDPDGADQAIWMVSLANGTPRKLADGSAPAVSPKGDVVAFLRRGEVWAVSLADSVAKPAQLFKARGSQGNLVWSPDGSMLAFVSGRGDHSFIGVYDRAKNEVRYLEPSVDRDGEPTWSPDGRRVAFVRIPGFKRGLPFIERREGEPWSIRVADVASGEGREIWRAARGRGSVFHGVAAEDQLFWAAGDRIVFPWERDGWVHLYSVPIAGGSATLLTPGEFEVEHVTISSNGREMVYSSNQGDIDRRHLWRVPVTGGAPVAITRGTGIEWSPAVAGAGTLAFLASDAREVLAAGASRRPLTGSGMPAGFPAAQLVEPQPVIFSAADGMRIHGQLFQPRDTRPGERRPAVVFFHGGSRRQMLLGWHYMYYYHNTYAQNQYLANKGYVVLSVNYRSGIGYGMEFREALNYGAHGASEYQDVVGAGLYLRSRPDVDPDRIGLWGGSYGGYLTALGLARSSDRFKAGVDLHGVHDWNVVIRNFAPSYDATSREDVARLAFQSSPMASVATWRSPVLLIHGDDDRNVPFSETVDIVESLRAQGVEFEQLIFPDEVHDFLLHRHWLQAYQAAADFFDRKLKGGAAVTR